MKKKALDYHALPYPGKISVISSKPTNTQENLSLAYSPGVAEPCLEIVNNKQNIYQYTNKGNLVAVISDGSAVLGLGNIGPEASKPVMEGKSVLFKIFADIDVFDIELKTSNVEDFIKTVKSLAPTFGGINLEDIKAPECFQIEKILKNELDIPVMHDDQHGTAIISGAALINALKLQSKKINKIKIVISGAGAAAISCAKMYILLGACKKNIFMFDSKGIINSKRNDLNNIKLEFATDDYTINNLKDALKGADFFVGLSKGGILDTSMLKVMAKNPIVFAMANPNPEIDYNLAIKTRNDIIIATGRSDFPNQVNNVLGFPYIFRGALDVKATTINDEMKVAAVYAIAKLAKKPVPYYVNKAYNNNNIVFSKNYIIPKPLDYRLLINVSIAVAKQAIVSKIANNKIHDWQNYECQLRKRLNIHHYFINNIINKIKYNPKKIIFSNADNFEILKSAEYLYDEKIAIPILLGNKEKILDIIKSYNLQLNNVLITDINNNKFNEMIKCYLLKYYSVKNICSKDNINTIYKMVINNYEYYGNLMLDMGIGQSIIKPINNDYYNKSEQYLNILNYKNNFYKTAIINCFLIKEGIRFICDVNINDNQDNILSIIDTIYNYINSLGIKPSISIISYKNIDKLQSVIKLLKIKYPNTVLDASINENRYCFNNKFYNVIISLNYHLSNITYKLFNNINDKNHIGPILIGLQKSIYMFKKDASINDIINTAILSIS